MAEIRKLEPADVGLLDAGIRVLKGRSSPAPEMFLRDPHAHAVVAIDDDTVVGCAYGYELFRPDGFWSEYPKCKEAAQLGAKSGFENIRVHHP